MPLRPTSPVLYSGPSILAEKPGKGCEARATGSAAMSRVTMIQHINLQISDKERTGFQWPAHCETENEMGEQLERMADALVR